MVFPGDTIVLDIKREKSFRLRFVNVEFEGKLRTHAQGESEDTMLIYESYKYENMDEFPINIQIPPGLYSSSKGFNYDLFYVFRVTFDIRLGRNQVITIPVKLINNNPPMHNQIITAQ